MSNSNSRILVVIGSGPGIGDTTAATFAEKRFSKIVLVARNKDRLEQDAHFVKDSAAAVGRQVEVQTFAVDVTHEAELKQVLAKIENWGQVECVLFNAARVIPSEFFSHSLDEIRYDFEITTIALYVVASWAHPLLKNLASEDPGAHPTILVTNSHLWNDPAPEIFALSLTKAAQHNMVRSLAQWAANDGVHVGLISPCGVVSPEEKNRNPKNVAVKAWESFLESRENWTLDKRIE